MLGCARQASDTINNYNLVADYQKRPKSVEAFEKTIGAFNKANVRNGAYGAVQAEAQGTCCAHSEVGSSWGRWWSVEQGVRVTMY